MVLDPPLRIIRPLLVLIQAGMLVSCASLSSRKEDRSPSQARQVVMDLCTQGAATNTAKGDLWMKAKSKEASGQFSAVFKAEKSGEVVLDVMNPFGGTEAQLKLSADTFQIRGGSNSKNAQGRLLQAGERTWGGIPLEWAAHLLMGGFPCPEIGSEFEARWLENEPNQWRLEVQQSRAGLHSAKDRFLYTVDKRFERDWVSRLEWKRTGIFAQEAIFEFFEPHLKWGVPQKWSAVSPQGEVTVKWRNVELLQSLSEKRPGENQ